MAYKKNPLGASDNLHVLLEQVRKEEEAELRRQKIAEMKRQEEAEEELYRLEKEREEKERRRRDREKQKENATDQLINTTL